jgi:hypothetical protein
VALTQAPQLDIAPPRFGGARTARSESDGTLTVDWAAASDDHSPAGAMVYTVFEALLPDQFDFAHPLVVTAPGDVSARLPGPFQSDRPYYFCVRARDAAGNVDTNRITLVHGFMASDRSTPTFAGLTSAQVDSQARTCVLAWEEANDPDTPPAQIVYEVFEATSPGVYDFNAPPSYVSAPGASGMTLTDLAGDEDLNWVVRARDLGNNEDMNKAEQGGHTDVSFTANVQAIFTYNCAVVGCHVPGNPPQGLVLASGFSYGQTVNVASSEAPTSFRIVPSSPDTSYLYMKIMGTAKFSQMPAPATGNVLTDLDKDRVRRWIASGAIQN